MNIRGIAAGATALALAAGCGSSAAGAHHAKTGISAAQRAAVGRAVASECSAYRTMRDQMTGAAVDMTGVNGIRFALALGTDGRNDTWSGAISNASHLANVPGVPKGHNRARAVAASLARAGLGLSLYQLAINGGASWHVKHHDLDAAVQAIQSADTACPG